MLYLGIGIVMLVIACFIAFAIYKRSYFKSEAFRALSEKTDDVVAQYDELKDIVAKFQTSTYADFVPTAKQQMEMQSYRTGAIDQNKTLGKYEYFCTSPLLRIAKENPSKMLKDFCGFASMPRIIDRVEMMLKSANDIEQRLNEFTDEYNAQCETLKSEIPFLINMFAKKEMLFLLGLSIQDGFRDAVYPKYKFVDMSSHTKTETITLDPNTIRTLSTYLEDHSETRHISLDFTKG